MNPSDTESRNCVDEETIESVYNKYILLNDAAICQVEYDSELEEMDRNYPNDDSDSEYDEHFHLANDLPNKVVNDEYNEESLPIDWIINSEPMKVKDKIILETMQKLQIVNNEKDAAHRKAMLLTADKERLAANLQFYKHEFKNLNEEMAALQSKCDQLKIDLAHKDTEIESLKNNTNKREGEHEASLIQLQEKYSMELRKMQSEINTKDNNIEIIQKKCEDQGLDLKQLEKAVVNKSNTIRDLQQQLVDSKKVSRRENNETSMRCKELQHEIKKYEMERNDNIIEITKLYEEIYEVKNKYLTLSEDYQKEKKIASEVVRLQIKLGYFEVMNQDKNEHENEVKTLKAQHELAKRLESVQSSTTEIVKTESRSTSPMKTNVLKHKSTQCLNVSTAHTATSYIMDRKVQTAEKSTATTRYSGQVDHDLVITIMHELGSQHQQEINRLTKMEMETLEQNKRLLLSIITQFAAKLENHKEQVVRLEMELKAVAMENTKLRSKYENAKIRYEAKIIQSDTQYMKKTKRHIEMIMRPLMTKEKIRESNRDHTEGIETQAQ